MNRIYLDWASSAPLLPQAAEAQKQSAYRLFGNPSSLHAYGREARAELEAARTQIARAADAHPDEVVFSSGATEANHLVVGSFFKRTLVKSGAQRRGHIVASAIEHASLQEPFSLLHKMGYTVTFVRPEADGIVSPDRIAAALSDHTLLVTLMLINNETGARQPVRECAARVREHARRTGRAVHLHTDAVQAFGKLWFSFHELGVDSAAISSHKLGGPRGIGALLVRRGAPYETLFSGGGQEQGRRSGTENTGGAAGFAASVSIRVQALDANLATAERLLERLLDGLRAIEGVLIIPEGRSAADTERYSPYILTVCIPPVPGEVLVRTLDDQGFALSTGSACHSGKKDATRILEAQGVTKTIARGALRISIGPETTVEEIDHFLGALAGIVGPLTKIAGKSNVRSGRK